MTLVTGQIAQAADIQTLVSTMLAAETTRAETAEAAALQKANNLSELTNATVARTNLGLGSAAVQAATAFDAAGAAAAEQTRAMAAEALINGLLAGRNFIHNPLFNVAQSGIGPWTTSGYTLDRWQINATHSTGSVSVSQVTLADADRAAIGDEAAEYALAYTFTGGTGSGDFDIIQQPIEDARRLSGKTVTVGFWAKPSAAGLKVGIGALQSFGTGGSPSTSVQVNSTAITLAAGWARYSVQVALPSTAGKTFGTSGNSSTALQIFLSAGTGQATAAGNIGVQSGTVEIWDVQVQTGASNTLPERRDIQTEIALCQRFAYPISGFIGGYGSPGSVLTANSYNLPQMRATPTISILAITNNNNVSLLQLLPLSPNSYDAIITTSNAGGMSLNFTGFATANL